MIIVRSPLRVTLGGGGTDLPSYYQEHGGFLLAAAIDKYVYITLHTTFDDELIVKYSKSEKVKSIADIKHPIIREVLNYVGINRLNLEITTMADIPAGTGLGSSGSFTTALLKALHTLNKNPIHARELAEQACHIKLELLREPIGKQDQYIAAHGGVTQFHFHANHEVDVQPLRLNKETLYNLEENLLLFFTGYSRSASSILKDQDDKSKAHDATMIEHLHVVKEIGLQSLAALENNNLNEFAQLMNEHWQHKMQRSPAMSNSDINRWYELAMANGALGGKVVGAGGGGFLMFYAQDKVQLRQAMAQAGLKEVRFGFDFQGSQVMTQG